MVGKIPGRLKAEDADQLAELVQGKSVLMLGCYCGRGLITVANAAKQTWVLDDFLYPGGVEGVVEELKANVERLADEGSAIHLLHGTVNGWNVPEVSEDLRVGEIELVYRDANRREAERERDERFALALLHDRGGVYAWHDAEGRLRWLQIDPVPVEVN